MRAIIWTAVSSEKQAGVGTISLDVQEKMARDVCLERGWNIVEILRMAHSRNYTDLNKWAAHLAKTGNMSGSRLFELWNERNFDVLVVHTMDRLGSTSSMITRVIEETVRMGATVYVISDHTMIDHQNFPIITAFASFFTATRMRKVHEMRDIHIDSRVQNGGPGMRSSGLSHVVLRGATRNDDRLVINEDFRQMWIDAARLFIEQKIATNLIEQELYKQYGWVNPKTGKPLTPNTYYFRLHRVTFWGHSVRHFGGPGDEARYRKMSNAWVYDVSVPVPPDIDMYRNTHEAVYKGELAAAVIEEIKRRKSIVKGNANPNTHLWASGLFACDNCGYRMGANTSSKRSYVYWSCKCAYSNGIRLKGYSDVCDKRGYIRGEILQEQVNAILLLWFENPDPELFEAKSDRKMRSDPDAVRAEIADIKTKMDRLVDLQLSVTDDELLQRQYAAKLQQLSTQYTIKARVLNIALSEEAKDNATEFRNALERIREIGTDNFWRSEPATINQQLSVLLRQKKFLVNIASKKIVAVGKGRTHEKQEE